jgi:hypothetical protein
MTEPMSFPEQNDPSAGDGFSLRAPIEALYRYRRLIRAALAAVAILYTVAALTTFLVAPVEHESSVHFRLLFDGAAKGEYPNATKFSAEEIVAAPVLTSVFAANQLDRFSTYDAFKDAVYVLQSNPGLDLLTYEYQAKLADTRLSSVDRSRIEDEFQKRRESVKDPSFSLNFRRHERLLSVPRDLAEKVLRDTLATWAAQAEQTKGVARYNVPVPSRSALPAGVLDIDDPFIAQDMLRAAARHILDDITALEKLPGAQSFRTSQDHRSLGGVKISLQNVMRFDIEPLLMVIRAQGVSRNAALYAENQHAQVKREYDAATSIVRTQQDALQAYTNQRASARPADGRSGAGGPAAAAGLETQTTIPQLSDSFLDRLVQMSSQTQISEVAFRQKLTEQIVKDSGRLTSLQMEVAYYDELTRSMRDRASGGPADNAAPIKARAAKAYAEIGTIVDQVVLICNELSARNLNPATVLYTVTIPYTDRARHALAVSTIALYFALVLMLTLVVVPAGCLVHHGLVTMRRSHRV